MKKVKFLIFLIFFPHFLAQAAFTETEKLSGFCKIWGFLKYYHPAVADGKLDWDAQFIMLLPKVEAAQNAEVLSEIYLQWIDGLGKVPVCQNCVSNKSTFEKNFSLEWINNRHLFSDALSKKLQFIAANRHQGKKHYVKTATYGNILMTNEIDYAFFEFPEKNYRLLSLARYWNVVEYFFPYKYMSDQNWDSVLAEMIPRFLNAQNAPEYQLALAETTIKMDDGHASLYPETVRAYFGKKYIPAYFNIIENKAVIIGFTNRKLAEANGLQLGDILERTGQTTVSQKMADTKKYVSGSNRSAKAKNHVFSIFNGETDSVAVTISRDGKTFTKSIGRYTSAAMKEEKPVETEKYKILHNTIGYVNIELLDESDVDAMMETFKNTKAMVVDLRNYPKFIPYAIARRLISKNTDYLKTIAPDLSFPGKFYWQENARIKPLANQYYPGNVVILVNEKTQSRAEYSAMMLQAGDHSVTIGSQTAGADGNVSRISYIGFESYMSGTGIFYPDGTPTQRSGIKIDIQIKPTIEGVKTQKDEVLQRAIYFINFGK